VENNKNILNKGHKKQVHLQDLNMNMMLYWQRVVKNVQTKSIHIFLQLEKH